MSILLREHAPAKVNLSLHVLGRRSDGYHDLESVVVFADCADEVALVPGPGLSLEVGGETAAASGPPSDNLILKAAAQLQSRIAGLTLGAFRLSKQLPVAAGLGGGSADAAATLRLLARANALPLDDDRLAAAARATCADCYVCLRSKPALMSGLGDKVRVLDAWPRLDAVLVNPGVEVPTAVVFRALGLLPGQSTGNPPHPPIDREAMAMLAAARNDLEPAACRIAPVIETAKSALTALGSPLVRMSGSGATVFGLFPDRQSAYSAALQLARQQPGWWVKAARFHGSGESPPSVMGERSGDAAIA